MNPFAAAWRVPSKEEGLTYKLQINNITRKTRSSVKKACKGWKEAGIGWIPSEGTQTFFFIRSFETPYLFKKWAKTFPYELEVHRDTRGRKKKAS